MSNSSLGLAGVGQKGNGTRIILCKRTNLQPGLGRMNKLVT